MPDDSTDQNHGGGLSPLFFSHFFFLVSFYTFSFPFGQESQAQLSRKDIKQLEAAGVAIRRLQLENRRLAMYGRTEVELGCRLKQASGAPAPLPTTRLGSGDIVGIATASQPQQPFAQGVIVKLTAMRVSIALDENFSDNSSAQVSDATGASSAGAAGAASGGAWGQTLVLVQLANTVTYDRLCASAQALLQVPKTPDHPAANLVQLLFGPSDQRRLAPPLTIPPVEHMAWANQGLNESQRAAVHFALSRPDIAVIHGPPGTGKTTTVVELIVQHVRQKRRVLVAAPSNIAVDNVLERLVAAGITRCVRLGHPARLLSSVQDQALDALLDRSESMEIARDVKKELWDAMTSRGRFADKRGASGATIKELRRELREREAAAMAEILRGADVVCGTTTTVNSGGPLRHLPPHHFDVAVVDEAGQALEVACWTALLQAPRCVLAGDHLQLPPTITSPDAARQGLSTTLLERVVQRFASQDAVRMLDIQYRMHQLIQDWSSHQFYQGQLQPAAAVQHHRLCDLEGVETTDETEAALLFVDTAGANLSEMVGDDDISKANPGEAAIVQAHVEALLAAGVPADKIGVITPYNLQVDTIRNLFSGKLPPAVAAQLEVMSVDGFQGREKEAIVISLVRSNPEHIIGFLQDQRRLNVAVTRARRHLCIVADSSTVAHEDACLSSLVDYLYEHAEMRTAFDYDAVLPQLSVTRSQAPLPPSTSGKRRGGDVGRAASGGDGRKSVDEAENAKRREALRQQLTTFLATASPGQTMDLPASLNSWERRVVHELCEELRLGHTSLGEGDARFARVTQLRAPARPAANEPGSERTVPDDAVAPAKLEDDGGTPAEGATAAATSAGAAGEPESGRPSVGGAFSALSLDEDKEAKEKPDADGAGERGEEARKGRDGAEDYSQATKAAAKPALSAVTAAEPMSDAQRLLMERADRLKAAQAAKKQDAKYRAAGEKEVRRPKHASGSVGHRLGGQQPYRVRF